MYKRAVGDMAENIGKRRQKQRRASAARGEETVKIEMLGEFSKAKPNGK